jgi:hypothetical protein
VPATDLTTTQVTIVDITDDTDRSMLVHLDDGTLIATAATHSGALIVALTGTASRRLGVPAEAFTVASISDAKAALRLVGTLYAAAVMS